MRPPAFWQRPASSPGWQAHALTPLSMLYARATARRVARPPAIRPKVPVISVGNLNVGGTGKTPTVIALAERLGGRNVHVVSRGYGGELPGPLRVDIAKHSAREVGDEPLLLAAFTATWICRDRAAGVALAEDAGAEVIGISGDSVGSHEAFASKYNLPFTLLSDAGDKVRKLYGVPAVMWVLPGRVTYVIDKEGTVRHIFDSMLEFDKHVSEAMTIVKGL